MRAVPSASPYTSLPKHYGAVPNMHARAVKLRTSPGGRTLEAHGFGTKGYCTKGLRAGTREEKNEEEGLVKEGGIHVDVKPVDYFVSEKFDRSLCLPASAGTLHAVSFLLPLLVCSDFTMYYGV